MALVVVIALVVLLRALVSKGTVALELFEGYKTKMFLVIFQKSLVVKLNFAPELSNPN